MLEDFASAGFLPKLPERHHRNGSGSVPPIYTKGGTPYYNGVLERAPLNRSCTRRKTLGKGAFALRARGGVIAFNARSSPIPLPLWGGASLGNERFPIRVSFLEVL
jgi:hypothetical protein